MNVPVKVHLNKKKTIRRRYILAAVFLLLLIIFALVFSFLQEPKPDPASEAVIRQEAAKLIHKDFNEMTDDDLTQINSFTLGENIYASVANPLELCDIKLLEKFTALEWLCLGRISYPRDKIPKWMIILAKFGLIDLYEKFVLDLSPLGKLNNLRTLSIYDTTVKDIRPLSSLTNLQNLLLVNTNITDEQVGELQQALPDLEIKEIKFE